jgi:phospholipase C
VFEHNTLADLLDAASLNWRYYGTTPDGIWMAPNAIRHICAPTPYGNHFACSGPAWTDGSVVPTNPAQVLSDIEGCGLAAVSWVTPTALESDHPISNDGTGPQWVASIVNAAGQQPGCASGESYWQDTAILITWDDWGGWYDHVPPFAVNV